MQERTKVPKVQNPRDTLLSPTATLTRPAAHPQAFLPRTRVSQVLTYLLRRLVVLAVGQTATVLRHQGLSAWLRTPSLTGLS